jgi:N-acetylmuramic acid 6-phosphate etherase
MAGGDRALRSSFEDAEDSLSGGAAEIEAQNVASADIVVGIAASGGTPYVIGALRAARQRGALTISLACSSPSAIAAEAEIAIAPLVGPEVITGSTRMKAGTAQKMVLNMLSSATMIRLGKTYGNLMVDVQQSNAKLRDRAVRIVADICALSREDAAAAVLAADGDVKLAIVMTLVRCDLAQARARLERAGGHIKAAL